MAIFKKNKKAEVETKEVAVVAPGTGRSHLAHVLKAPRITEKATMSAMKDVYVFDIDARATKREIVKALQEFYKVTPIKVHVASYPAKVKRNMRTGKIGRKQGGRKAYVYLKKGDEITIA